MVVYRTVLSDKSPFFLRKFQKSLQVKRNQHILKSEIYLITCKLSQKTDPKGEKQQYSLDSVNERRILLFTFPFGSEYCSFGVNMSFFTKKISVQRPKTRCSSLCCVFNFFYTQKVHIFYAFKVSTVPVGLSVMQIQCIKSRARCLQYHAMQCCCNEIIKTT